MRVIVAGSRDFNNRELLNKSLDEFIKDNKIEKSKITVVSGGAKGADLLGEQWAIDNNLKVDKYPADWSRLGRIAGFKRNKLMLENADALIVFWDGNSLGTRHMIAVSLHKLPIIKIIRFVGLNSIVGR